MSDDKKLIEVQHLQQYFPAGGRGKKKKYVQAVDDVSFYIKKGETLGLVGESGCGKTTVGRTLLRLYEPTDGTIIYDGDVIFDKKKKISVNMLPYRRKMQMVFQDPYASLDPRMTIGDIVAKLLIFIILPPTKRKDATKSYRFLRPSALTASTPTVIRTSFRAPEAARRHSESSCGKSGIYRMRRACIGS